MSQVLTGRARFSREQAFRVSLFLEHDAEEACYFMALFDSDRAGSKDLRQYQERVRKGIIETRSAIKERLRGVKSLDESLQSDYYESWHFAAAHIATALPFVVDAEDVAKVTGLSPARARSLVEWLLNHGLVTNRNGSLGVGRVRVHLGAESQHAQKHHTNWRLRTLENLQTPPSPGELHYSSVLAVSYEFKAWLKESLLKLLQEAEPLVLSAPEETLLHFGFDLFSLDAERRK